MHNLTFVSFQHFLKITLQNCIHIMHHLQHFNMRSTMEESHQPDDFNLLSCKSLLHGKARERIGDKMFKVN